MAANNKRTLYVGGLEEHVTAPILQAAFLPFGDVVDVQVPVEQLSQKHRGFGFVEFEHAEDAQDALDNMNNAELYGRVLKVNIAKPLAIKDGANKSVWSEADRWYKERLKEDGYEVDDAIEDDAFAQAAEKGPATDSDLKPQPSLP
mmetsp:Transcript_27564/g.47573  ORF Transcript_27564/g.47573 Transcript_27564/m.47573 type:complete len:146 (-) Transcript_27564:462-899(-)|eukprot:CAMPEP_0196667870 /NCGR_PEP_ID=MMETSP1086-20130531/65316_1 /TAXON_ID=77921 /ORGANISM="Cyanoptyche  gloeocystis , Strain SAG4.97" /LENGTH=145 /DNA_ID=CAMNT_0042005233 /DNA_START=174 /DNA_END=611 /DNA_ORIENTATION=-